MTLPMYTCLYKLYNYDQERQLLITAHNELDQN